MPVNVDEFIKDWLQQKSVIVNKVYEVTHHLLREMLIRYHHEATNSERPLPKQGANGPDKQNEP